NEAGQVLALRRAYADGNVDPEALAWVIAHATGTQAGDSTELAALNAIIGSGPAGPISSNKAIVGHAGWAAGTLSIVQALLGRARGEVPPQRYSGHPTAAREASRFAPPTDHARLRGSRPRRVAVSAFGFGGTNAHVILGEDAATVPERRPRPSLATEEIVVVG